MHGKHGVIVSFLLTNKVWMQMLLSSENVTLIVKRFCHPRSIWTLNGLRQGWSGPGLYLLEQVAFGFKTLPAIRGAGANGSTDPGMRRGRFLVRSTGASGGAGLVRRHCPL